MVRKFIRNSFPDFTAGTFSFLSQQSNIKKVPIYKYTSETGPLKQGNYTVNTSLILAVLHKLKWAIMRPAYGSESVHREPGAWEGVQMISED